MYFSDREKKILTLLLEYQEGMTVGELRTQIGVSKRTIYREIASIEKSIVSYDLKVIKPRGGGYRLVGDSKNMKDLRLALESLQEEAFTNVQRQSAIAALLLMSEEETTIESLSIDFRVSQNTINADLLAVEEGLGDYQLKLLRLKGRGILIRGSEMGRRQILSNLIYKETNEYAFFQYIEGLKDGLKLSEPNNFFMNLIAPADWYLAQKVILQDSSTIFSEVTDNQLQLLLIELALSITRIRKSKYLKLVNPVQVSKPARQLADVLAVLIEKEGTIFSESEIDFLSQQLEGLNYKVPQNIFLDSFDVELSYHVKELIRIVSEEYRVDFRKDDSLFYDLVAHLSAAVKRAGNLKVQITNPLLGKIISEYHPLYQVMVAQMGKVFPNSEFSEDELAYILIHFASALERNPEIHSLSILVLCSSGIGTAQILESRLRRYIRNVSEIKVARISQMSQLDFREYDLILSTIFLPGFDLPYKIISPLLLDDELTDIKSYIKEELIAAKEKNEEVTLPDMGILKHSVGGDDNFTQLYDTMKAANNLLQRFDVKNIEAEETLEETLFALIDSLSGILVSNVEKVTAELLQRYKMAPIGIPKTNIALFHSANNWVKDAYFAIFDLNRSFEIQGMDKKTMMLQRILLMLAPEPMSERVQSILGKISSSIIESDLNTKTYQEGDKKEIYQLLSSLFVDEIKVIQ